MLIDVKFLAIAIIAMAAIMIIVGVLGLILFGIGAKRAHKDLDYAYRNYSLGLCIKSVFSTMFGIVDIIVLMRITGY